MRGDEWRLKYKNDLFAVISLLLLVALRFLPTFVSGRLYAPFGDNVFIYGPMFSETARIALHGEYPFYLPSFGTGFPLYQSPHYSPFYPFYFFGLLDYGGPLQSLYTLTYLTILHRFILALNFFVMLRCARISPWASFVGASIGVFAYNTEVYAGWITITSSYTWFPLLIAGGILLLRNSRSVLGIILLGASAGLLALASASQAIAHAVFFSLVFFSAGAIWVFRKSGSKAVLRLIVSLLFAGAIAFGVGGVSAVPVYLGVKDMVRHIGAGFVLGHEKIPWEKFSQMQMTFTDFPSILLNPGHLAIVGSPYVGPLGLAGVVFAFFFFRRLDSFSKLLAITIGAIGLFGLLSAFGTHLGLAYLNYQLPLLNKIREAGRYLVLFLIGVVFLSGIGFDQLGSFCKEGVAKQHGGRGVLIVLGAVVVLFVAVTGWELSKNAPLAAGGGLTLLLAPAVFVLGLFSRTPALRYFLISVVFVSIAALISPPRTFPVQLGDYSKVDNLRSLATLSELRKRLPSGDFRVDFVDQKANAFTWGMNASFFDFDSFYNRLTPQPYEQFRISLQTKPANLREIMGGRYVLCAPGLQPVDPAATSRFEINGCTLFENPSYMERLTLVHSLAGTVLNEGQFIARARRGFDFRQSVYLQNKDGIRLKPFLNAQVKNPAGVEERVKLTKNSVNKLSALVETSRPGIIILNEWFTPAWRALVNGRVEGTVRANQWQIGVPVKAGRNVIDFNYRPSPSWYLLILNRVTWVLLAMFAVIKVIGKGAPKKQLEPTVRSGSVR